MNVRTAAIVLWLTAAAPGSVAGANYFVANYFVAKDGADGNPGTIEEPFATVQRANAAVAPGDTVEIRGGIYEMEEGQIARKRGIFAEVIRLGRGGAEGKPVVYRNYGGERVVFDFSKVAPAGMRVHAFSVPASHVHLLGLEVVGVRVTMKGHTQSICFENNGSHNIFERLKMHDGEAIGIYSVRGSGNLFLNCDAYNNWDRTSEGGRGGNVDGFGCHPRVGDKGNVFRGCRAWFNSDDGFDCISAGEAVVFENCWAFYNGYSPEWKGLADGNGFKAGGYGSTPVGRLPRKIPRHVVRGCLAVGNRTGGFYANHHIGGCDWIGNTAYKNGSNFNMLCRLGDNRTDVPGYGHRLVANLSYRSRMLIGNIDREKCEMEGNAFGGDRKLADGDFVSLDESVLTGERRSDGGLPLIPLMKPRAGSGIGNVGYQRETAE